MNARIPVMYDRALKPEWIDYALEQYINAPDEHTLSKILRDYLEIEITTATSLRKTISQLQHCVGFLSPLPKEKLLLAYDQMKKLAPSQRKEIRFKLLVETTPFIADVVGAIRKITALGVEGIEVKQLYERLIERYGERGTIPRRVRYVLKTLANMGIIENKNKKWYIIDVKGLEK